MPIFLDWNPDCRMWMLTAGETLTLDEVTEITEKTDWQGGKRFLWDLRDLRQGPDSSEQLREAVRLVEKDRQLWAGSRTAIVVARDVDFGIARMFQVLADGVGVEYQVFRDLQAATDWLTNPPAQEA